MIFFLRSIFAQTLLNAYLVYRIWKSREIPQWLKWLLSFIFGAETIVYFVGLLGGERLSVEVFTLIQKISGTWVIGSVYLALLISLFDLINYADKRWLFFKRLQEKIVRRIKISCFLASLAFIGIQLYCGYENFVHPRVKTFTFPFLKTETDPVIKGKAPKKTYKMLVASDIHLGYIIDKEILRKYVDFINDQKADIVIIDGDLIDYSLRPLVAGQMNEELSEIKAPKGVFFIPGNHEYKFNPELKLDWIAQTGIIVLKDSVVNIDNQLILIGRDDLSNEDDRMPIEKLMSKVDTSKPCIFLAHQPGDIKDAYKYNIPLTVCGHTHGGQAFPINLLGHLLYSNSYGMDHTGNCYSYVTSGLGLSGFPLRVGTHSEIVVFNIEIY